MMSVKSKNIHVLSTKGLSRLVKGETTGRLLLHDIYGTSTDRNETQNIYITSDEEIKERVDVKDKWVISEYGFVIKADRIENNYLIHSNGGSNYLCYYKFIILTTDQDLIKDGVQSIDDEFLEWFAKNPSCEFVKTKLVYDYEEHPELVGNPKEEWSYYKIIIPKEEPKQEKDYTALLQPVGTKQETLEQAKQRILDSNYITLNDADIFEIGVNWQQEQDKNKFSEQEVELIANELVIEKKEFIMKKKLKNK
jgi:hypothetical protein